MKYDNILNKCEFEGSRVKVKVTVAVFRKNKLCHRSSAFIYGLILILLQTNMLYDYTLGKFKSECSWAKVKVTVAIFRKIFSSY